MERITIRAKDLYDYVDKLKEDESIKAVEISIYEYENDEGSTKKYFCIDIIECGGFGLISNEEAIEEMTPEEILSIDNPNEITEKDIFYENLINHFTNKQSTIDEQKPEIPVS